VITLLIAAGVGLAVLGALWGGRLRGSAAWFALGLAAQAAALMLIEAGPTVRFQHYVTLQQLSVHDLLPLALLAAQWAAVATGMGRRWRTVYGWLRRAFGPWQFTLFASLFVLASAVLSRSALAYAGELAFASAVQIVSLANAFLVIASLPAETRLRISAAINRLLGGGAEGGGRRALDGFAIGVAVWVVAVAALLSTVSYERHPHVPDEVVYLFQARYFAAGRLSVPVPPVPEAFEIDITVRDGDRWYAPTPPGWPAILALGVRGRIPWLINPLLAGASILLAYALLVDVYDRRTARMTVTLLAASPWFLFMGMNFMTHTATLAAALLGGLAVVRALRTGRLGWIGVAGAATGFVALVRPLEAVAVGLVLSALLVATCRGRRRLLWPAAFAFAAAAAVSPMLLYNKALTGSMTKFPLTNYVPEGQSATANALGFGPDRGFGWTGLDPLPGHGAVDVLINDVLNTALVNVELFGWATGSLFFLLVFVFAGRITRTDWAMLGVVAAVILVHSFYWFSGGPDFGARYWYLIVVPSVVLTVRGIQTLEEKLAADRAAPQRPRADAGVALLAGILAVGSLVTFVPWRAMDKYHDYRGMRPGIVSLAEQNGFGRSLVLIRGDRHPDYASAATYNPLDLQADEPIYAWDRDAVVRARVLAAYPDRPVWTVDGPCVTGRGYEVTGGPWPPGSLE